MGQSRITISRQWKYVTHDLIYSKNRKCIHEISVVTLYSIAQVISVTRFCTWLSRANSGLWRL
jgi:hypothetical protein